MSNKTELEENVRSHIIALLDTRYAGQRIEICKQALKIFNVEQEPDFWAFLQFELANALYDNLSGSLGQNIDEAIIHYKLALKIYNPETYLREWGMVQNNLANTFSERPFGSPSKNIEQSIEHYQNALKVFTANDDPDLWVTIMNNLGFAYIDRKKNNHSANIEIAINHISKASKVCNSKDFPFEWANTQHNLGCAYLERIQGSRGENIEAAIQYFQEALKVRTMSDYPIEWSDTVHNLATAYSERIHGDLADNVEKAIGLFLDTLQIRNRTEMPREWATTQNNLANSYMYRIKGNRAENLEHAILCNKLALEVFDIQDYPADWAMLQNNLATLYSERINGSVSENLEDAIRYYKQALRVYSPEDYPEEWAMVQNNLGASLSERVNGSRNENIEQAIIHFQSALIVFEKHKYPSRWAMTQLNLANAYRYREVYPKEENIEQAIFHYKASLTVYNKRKHPVDWALAHNNLGNTFLERIRGDQEQNAQQAIIHYKLALRIRKLESIPLECRITACNLGKAYFSQSRWTKAFLAYKLAVQSAEILFHSANLPSSRQQEASENENTFDQLQRVCIKLSNQADYRRRGFVLAEIGKMRTFLEQMSQGDFQPPQSIPESLVLEERKLLEALRNVEGMLGEKNLKEQFQSNLLKQRKELKEQLNEMWKTFEQNYPESMNYVHLRKGESPGWRDFQLISNQIGSDTAIVEFYTMEDCTLAYVLKDGCNSPEVVYLQLSELELYYRYIKPYEDEILNRRQGHEATNAWLDLGNVLIAPLLPILNNIKRIYFIPHGLLHLLPLHALKIDTSYVIELFSVVFAPSIGVLIRAMENCPYQNSSPNKLVLGYTNNPLEKMLFNKEATSVAELFSQRALFDEAASLENLKQKARNASIIHLSCHANFSSNDALDSFITLFNGDFCARDWMKLSLNAELVTLSACRTGFSEISHGDEIVGLNRALLYAGAKSTILTLWAVYAESTLEWMIRFYQYAWDKDGKKLVAKADAFQLATLDLMKKYSDPYYWAPFVLNGDGS